MAKGKGTCSELGVRVPLIVFGGPVKTRGVTDVLVDFTDMFPTILEIAGIDVTADGLQKPEPGYCCTPAYWPGFRLVFPCPPCPVFYMNLK